MALAVLPNIQHIKNKVSLRQVQISSQNKYRPLLRKCQHGARNTVVWSLRIVFAICIANRSMRTWNLKVRLLTVSLVLISDQVNFTLKVRQYYVANAMCVPKQWWSFFAAPNLKPQEEFSNFQVSVSIFCFGMLAFRLYWGCFFQRSKFFKKTAFNSFSPLALP